MKKYLLITTALFTTITSMQNEEDYCTEYHLGIETLKYENQIKISYAKKDTQENQANQKNPQYLSIKNLFLEKIYDTDKTKTNSSINTNSK